MSNNTCPISGLPIFAPERFQNIQLTDEYSVSFRLIGKHILISEPAGYVGEIGMLKLIEEKEKFLIHTNTRSQPFIELKDFTKTLTSGKPTKNSRKQLIDNLLQENSIGDLLAFYGFNTSPFIRWAFNVGTFLNKSYFPVKIVKNYDDAMTSAILILKKNNIIEHDISNFKKIKNKKIHKPINRFGTIPRKKLNKYITELINFLEKINWQGYLNDDAILDKSNNFDNPLSILYESFGLLKLEFDRALNEKEKAVSDNNKLQKELQQSEKMHAIGELAGGVAHDFNNQLTAIIGHIELLKINNPDNKEIASTADLIINTAEKSAELTSNLLTFARKQTINKSMFDINDVIKNTIKLLKPNIDKRINFKTIFTRKNEFFKGDEVHIQSVFINLILNAQDAITKNGTIKIKTDLTTLTSSTKLPNILIVIPGNYIKIEISDDGKGIPPEIQNKIFEPFFSTKKGQSITGMGLPSVYGTIKAHNGYLTLNSKINIGTTFSIYLPIEEIPDENDRHPKDDIALPKPKKTIMVIDDDPSICDTLKLLIESTGYTAVTFTSSKESLKDYKQNWNKIDVVIIDYMMPQLNGEMTFKKIRKINKNVKAIIMSGYNFEKESKRLQQYGIVDYLQKPFDITLFKNKLYSMLFLEE